METPKHVIVLLGSSQRKKIAKLAPYGKRSEWIRDAIDAYKGPFVPRTQSKDNKLSPGSMRFFKKQLEKIQREATRGYRSQYIRDAIDAF